MLRSNIDKPIYNNKSEKRTKVVVNMKDSKHGLRDRQKPKYEKMMKQGTILPNLSHIDGHLYFTIDD